MTLITIYLILSLPLLGMGIVHAANPWSEFDYTKRIPIVVDGIINFMRFSSNWRSEMTDYHLSVFVIFSSLLVILGRINSLSFFACVTMIFLCVLSIPTIASLQYFLGKRKAYTYKHYISQVYATFLQNVTSLFRSPWYDYFGVAAIIIILPFLIVFLARNIQ